MTAGACRVAERVTGRPVYDPLHRRLSDEHYRISGVAGRSLAIEACSPRALRWARVDLARRCGDELPVGADVDVRDGPAFAVRGVIEGFYGTPWSDEQRLDMIDFCAAHRLNTFCYTPKHDPYLRERWREQHAATALESLRLMIERCHAVDVTAMVGVSPGLSMQYSSADDRALLVAKVTALLAAGADRIALLFDDIPQRLQHRADHAAFASLAEAHADVANEVVARAHAHGGESLVVCPTVYHGDGGDEYVLRLGSRLDGRAELFSTGPAICSPELRAADAVTFARNALRPPLYWDNYPVNDVAMVHEAHVGPYRGRDPLLDRFSPGVLANAMENGEASKIAIATIADYLWAPAAYDPEESWQRALREVGGPDAEALTCFADAVRGSCLSDPEPVELGAELERFEFELAHGDASAARARLAGVADRLAAAAVTLQAPGAFNQRLTGELRPWLAKFAVGAEVVVALADATTTPARLAELAGELAARPQVVFGSVLTMAIDRALDAATTEPIRSRQPGQTDR